MTDTPGLPFGFQRQQDPAFAHGAGQCQIPISGIPDPGIRTPVLYDREIAPFAKISQIQARIFINILTG